MSDSDEDIVERQYKILIIGDAKTGKSSLAARYTKNEFSKQYISTAGVEFYLKKTNVSNHKRVTLKIWDTEGGALKSNMLEKYIYGADAIIFLYDVTDVKTIENIRHWMNACKLNLNKKTSVCILVANKIDLEHMRTVKSDHHHKFAQENQLLTHAVSAKTGEGVDLCFQKILAELLGIKLSKAEQEQLQPVVKAEIISYTENRRPSFPQTSVKTSVCSLQ